jgi:hypothetical protein
MTRTTESSVHTRKRAAARWWRPGSLMPVLVAAGTLAAACGGGGSHAAGSSSTSAQSRAGQSGVLFISCIRAHGLPNLPDSAVSLIGGQLDFHIPGYLKAQFPSAFRACESDLPAGDIPQAKRFNIPAELSFASCMRSHGITDFPDPLPGGGFNINLANTNSSQFEAAAQACQGTAFTGTRRHEQY